MASHEDPDYRAPSLVNRQEVVEALQRRIHAQAIMFYRGPFPRDVMSVEEGAEYQFTPEETDDYNREQQERDPNAEYAAVEREWFAMRFLLENIGIHLPAAEDIAFNRAWLYPGSDLGIDYDEED